MHKYILSNEPPYTERYVRWCERTVSEIITHLLLDGIFFLETVEVSLYCAGDLVRYRGHYLQKNYVPLFTETSLRNGMGIKYFFIDIY